MSEKEQATAGKPSPPAGLTATGRALWDSVTGEWELDPHEYGLLREMTRIADALDELDAEVRRDGVTVEGSHGGQKAHPALVERRQQAIAYARLAAVLRLPSGEQGADEAPGRRQRRVGVRGPYSMGIRGAVS